jgi:hypothetical protein
VTEQSTSCDTAFCRSDGVPRKPGSLIPACFSVKNRYVQTEERRTIGAATLAKGIVNTQLSKGQKPAAVGGAKASDLVRNDEGETGSGASKNSGASTV